MQRIGNDDVNVIDSGATQQIQHNLQHLLADVRRFHGRQRKADVVHRNRDLHAGRKLRVQRIAAERAIQRVANRRFGIRQSEDRRLWINHACSHRQIFQQEVFTVMQNPRL